MQAGADHGHTEADSPDPETQEPQPQVESGRKVASEPGQNPELQGAADPELTDQQLASDSEAESDWNGEIPTIELKESELESAASSVSKKGAEAFWDEANERSEGVGPVDESILTFDEARKRGLLHEELDAKLETTTQLPSTNAEREPTRQDPIKIQSAQADTQSYRRFLAGLFGAMVEGISGESEGPSPAGATSSDTGGVQPASEPGHESVNTEGTGYPRKPPPFDAARDYTVDRKIWAATLTGTTRQESSSPNVLARVLSSQGISRVHQLSIRLMDSLQRQRRWVISAMVLLFVALISITFLTITDGGLSSLARLAREIIPRNPPVLEGNANTFGLQEAPSEEPNDAGLFAADSTRTPGTDFAGAYVLSVEHVSTDSSMLRIRVPAGVEGTYKAVVTVSERLEYECVFLHHSTDSLYCVGPLLPEASKINLRIFKIDEADGSQNLVFETNYSIGKFAPQATPSPVFPIYGGAFTWPDRFNGVEIRKEHQNSAILAPLSALLSLALLLIYRRLSRGEHRLNRWPIETHGISPLH